MTRQLETDPSPATEALAIEPPSTTLDRPIPTGRPTTIDRLRVAMPTDRLTGWAVTLVITAIAFVTRVVNLGYPNKLVFDETYYAKDAYSLLTVRLRAGLAGLGERLGHRRQPGRDAGERVVHRASRRSASGSSPAASTCSG